MKTNKNNKLFFNNLMEWFRKTNEAESLRLTILNELKNKKDNKLNSLCNFHRSIKTIRM